MLRRCCGKLQDGSLLTPQKLSKNNQLKSPGMGNGMWNGGMKWRQEAATGGGATGGDRGRQEATLPPYGEATLPTLPPAHAEHAGIRRYGARRCNGGGIRCFAILQFVFNSSTSSC